MNHLGDGCAIPASKYFPHFVNKQQQKTFDFYLIKLSKQNLGQLIAGRVTKEDATLRAGSGREVRSQPWAVG